MCGRLRGAHRDSRTVILPLAHERVVGETLDAAGGLASRTRGCSRVGMGSTDVITEIEQKRRMNSECILRHGFGSGLVFCIDQCRAIFDLRCRSACSRIGRQMPYRAARIGPGSPMPPTTTASFSAAPPGSSGAANCRDASPRQSAAVAEARRPGAGAAPAHTISRGVGGSTMHAPVVTSGGGEGGGSG